MSKCSETSNPLVGKCPICAGAEPSDGHNDAYNASTIVDSDKNVDLVFSSYYQQWVCQLCEKEGADIIPDQNRNDEDRRAEKDRQKMGFVQNYTKNEVF